MSKVSCWSSSALKLALAIGLFSLTGMSVQAQNQTVSGHLHVTGDTSLSGALNVTGTAELNSNITNFGSNGANAATPGLVLTYTDTASGTISTITMATSGTSAIWQWERNSANGLIPQMTLTGTNSIILWNPTISNSVGIVLNPAGDSTFSGSITATGTNSRLPNQQISTDTASVLTKGYADGTYLTFTQAVSSYIPIGTSTLNVGYQTSATGSYSTALGYNTIAAGSGQIVVGQYNAPLVSEGDNSSNWVSTDALLVIGNGTSDQSRSNALVVSKNGDTLIAGSAIVGKRLRVSGKAAFADEVTIPQKGDLSMGSFTNSGLTRAQTVAEAYFSTLATSPVAKNLSDTEKENIISFLMGLDTIAGLENVVESWTFRSTQNMGSGPTAYGMKGAYNASIVGNVIWTSQGAKIAEEYAYNISYISAAYTIPTSVPNPDLTIIGVYASELPVPISQYFTRFQSSGVGISSDYGNFLADMPESGRILSGQTELTISSCTRMLGVTKTGPALVEQYKSGILVGSGNSNYDIAGASDLRLASNMGNHRLVFVVIIARSLNAAQHLQIYQLYKSTIGQGLGLP